MLDQGATRDGELVHLAAGDPRTTAQVSALLNRSGARTRTFTDAYRTLAYLGRSDQAPVEAIVVCMDFITLGEFEFFEIVRRRFPRSPVYVYGHERSDQKVSRALELGAKGRLSERVIKEAMASSHTATAKPFTGQGSVPHEVMAPHETADIEPDKMETVAQEDSFAEHPSVGTERIEQESNGVRVPWHGYQDKPSRVPPPPADKPLDDAPASRPEATSRAEAPGEPAPLLQEIEPLLSEAELQALIGPDDPSDEDGTVGLDDALDEDDSDGSVSS